MAITVNSTSNSNGQPSAPLRVAVVDVTLDNSYPAGGYDISDDLPDGASIVHSPFVPDYDGAALRWLKISATKTVQVFADNNGSPGSEVAGATDVSGHTTVELSAVHE